ncbi:hypothetical protein DL89DRAFT_130522 [Linderina pennispora]|uniref:Uncharacterized protein n=1 Tax=Linderina pennispora TaxID=61395 RepID=A0A1Y1VVJ9_9FUNG|nr:uncharacterized protein DL89DRAFT_130522 [Linderina pennispora]ORX65223.1 hypothetical protein DL89DRAFT_130522 [Linderina pennispora]
MAELNYMGNPVLAEYFLTPMHQAHQPITPEDYCHSLLVRFGHGYRPVTSPRIGQTVDTLDSGETSTGNFLAIAMNYKVFTDASNIASLKMYIADFGSGVQAFSTVHPELNMGSFMILPPPPPSKDILINYFDASSVMDSVMKNEFWSEFSELIY